MKKPAQQGAAAEWVPIDRLKMDPKNLKTGHDVDGIANSQAEFGWGEVIVAREQDGMIIAGHGRFMAATKNGDTTVPVRFLRVSVAKARRMQVALNKLGEKSSWDEPALAEYLSKLREEDAAAPGLLGFEDDEIDKLIAKVSAESGDDTTPGVSPDTGDKYAVIVECADERQQAMLLERLSGEGFEVRALVS